MATTNFTLFVEIIFNHITLTQTMKNWIEKCPIYYLDQNFNSRVSSLLKPKIILSCSILFIKSYEEIEIIRCDKS